MKYLFIDSATATLVVAIVIDGEITYLYNKHVDKDMSSNVMPVIAEAFKVSGIEPKDLNKIFAVNGPGSFTGIRVGLTVAKTMAWALKIPVVPISSLEAIASAGNDETNIALIDARRGYVYAGAYDEKLNNKFADTHILLEDLDIKGNYISYDGFEAIKPQVDVLKIIKKHAEDEGVNPHILNPKYLKLTEAEENLKKKSLTNI